MENYSKIAGEIFAEVNLHDEISCKEALARLTELKNKVPPEGPYASKIDQYIEHIRTLEPVVPKSKSRLN